jgi:hypothetical protein
VTPRPLVTVWTEERAEGSFVILRTHAGGQVHYGPFSPDGVEAAILHLGSALAMTAMRYQAAVARPALAVLGAVHVVLGKRQGPGRQAAERPLTAD